MNKRFLSPKKFNSVYSQVPRLCVDLIIIKNKKILLTKRSIPPFKGMWHLPGGGVLHRETIKDAISRIAKAELRIKVIPKKLLGYIEILREGYKRHSITMEFKCKMIGNVKPKILEQASTYRFFNKIPTNIISQQGRFLRKNWKSIFR